MRVTISSSLGQRILNYQSSRSKGNEMILRKLAAATIASSVLASGAVAQVYGDSATSDVTLEILERAQVTIDDIAFTDGSTNGATQTANLCVWTSTTDYALTFASDSNWELRHTTQYAGAAVKDNYRITYSLSQSDAGVLADSTTYNKANFGSYESSVECLDGSTTPDFEALTATITEQTASKVTGSYSDTITVSVSAI
ncbi:hypothetical protein DFR27_1177 [Umboniibacter marinipuniceus]|uniref:Spore coat protein U-like protein n=2 Tax=Umboniibacter marinipuniceus TaxID=569599 RepID=A0A3M0A914_9GAMM|nr:hypothetical protein DFR27_1177 [Umboniibacter marinipuniceus]